MGLKRLRSAGFVSAVVALGVALMLLSAPASGRPTSTPRFPHARHCGLFDSVVEWEDAPHIKGHYYSYAEQRIKPLGRRGKACTNAYRIAELALLGNRHPDGFSCTVAAPSSDGERTNSGYCYKGNPHRRSRLRFVSWAPQTDCAIPDPPYTPAKEPSFCHS